ncbi:MAG: hypothetical protein PHQ05_02910 [Sterolibacterium sp.]|nr:hypothetical protein [Sterolibacterium sp.]
MTNIIAAEEYEVEAIGESPHPVDEWSGIEIRDVDVAKIATLHCLLTGDLFDDAVYLYQPAYVSTVEGTLVLRLADEVMERLAELDEETLEQIAVELAATEEFEYDDWPEEATAALLAELSELARLADSQAQSLFVWIYPLRT